MSFLKQYGIHDFDEYLRKISWEKFCKMVAALDETTPLIKMAQIRKETNPAVMEYWTPEQRRINAEWQRKLAKEDAERTSEEEMRQRYAALSDLLSGIAT